jgi:hypothetical protein
MERKLSALLLVQQQMSKRTMRVVFSDSIAWIAVDNFAMLGLCMCPYCPRLSKYYEDAHCKSNDTIREITRLLRLADGTNVNYKFGHAHIIAMDITDRIVISDGVIKMIIDDGVGLEIVQRLVKIAPHVVRKN